MKITVPHDVKAIIEKLEACGFSAYAVGGCIRDSLMGKQPHDWDICTSAKPEEILGALGTHNIIESGLKHGTVTVKVNEQLYEITTFRSEGEYRDNRRPESVKFITSLKEDLSRRDFTVNAMAYNSSEGLCDYFGGESDIGNMIIRCVGDPDKRFTEDALRIMRALRFASKLGFEIEENTKSALRRNAHLLKKISVERITAELVQILDGEFAEQILLDYTDVLGVFLPEILPMVGLEQRNPHHSYDVWTHTVYVIVNSPHGKVMRLAALLHDIAKPRCFTIDEKGTGHFHGHPEVGAKLSGKILRRLHLDNDTIAKVGTLIRYHDQRPKLEPKYVRRLISKTGIDCFEPLMELKRADAKGQNPQTIPPKLEYIDELEKMFHELTSDGNEFNIRSLKLTGSDLIDLGIGEGKEIGYYLNEMLEMVIEGKISNDRNALIAEVSRRIKDTGGWK